VVGYPPGASSRGRGARQLYNGQSREWEDVVVDDRIPVKAGTTSAIFAKPHGKDSRGR
jgi:hypothetical protein